MAWGPHKVLIELADANHRTLDMGVVSFVIPEAGAPHDVWWCGCVQSAELTPTTRLFSKIGGVLPLGEFLALVHHGAALDENPLAAIVEGLRIFRCGGHVGFQHFKDEEIVGLHQTRVGNSAFQVRETLPDQRRGHFRAGQRSQVKACEFIDRIPIAIADAHHLIDQVSRRNIDYAFPALPNHREADIVVGDDATDERRGEFDDRMPAHGHDIAFPLPSGTDQDDGSRFEELPDPGNREVFFGIGLHAANMAQLVMWSK